MRAFVQRMSVVVLVASVLAACGSDPVAVAEDVLAGLSQVPVGDSSTNNPTPPVPAVPGNFRGVVVGYSSGPDSVDAPLANVRIAAHLRLNGVTSGDVAAETYSNGNGQWELPTLPAGEYAVIYEPGASSPYKSGYTIAQTMAESGFWTVMLPKK